MELIMNSVSRKPMVPATKHTRSLTNGIFRHGVPREVRDMVYDKLWDANALYNLDYAALLDSHRAGLKFNSLSTLMPHLVNVFNVSKPFAREAVEWLYRNYSGHGIEWDDLEDFFDTDVFDVGAKPRDCMSHIKKLTVVIEMGRNTNLAIHTPDSNSPNDVDDDGEDSFRPWNPNFLSSVCPDYYVRGHNKTSRWKLIAKSTDTLLAACKKMTKNFELTLRVHFKSDEINCIALERMCTQLKTVLVKAAKEGVSIKQVLLCVSYVSQDIMVDQIECEFVCTGYQEIVRRLANFGSCRTRRPAIAKYSISHDITKKLDLSWEEWMCAFKNWRDSAILFEPESNNDEP